VPTTPSSFVSRMTDQACRESCADRVFEPGFSTKQSGWGIGLSLAKRIVEENHGGKLVLAPTTQGATFEIILH
jgi:signal transduction histidine kinase